MTFEYSQEVINDYEKLFETDEGYDVIIHAGENGKDQNRGGQAAGAAETVRHRPPKKRQSPSQQEQRKQD